MKLIQSENKNLWYVYDEQDEIVFMSMFKEVCEDYILEKIYKEK